MTLRIVFCVLGLLPLSAMAAHPYPLLFGDEDRPYDLKHPPMPMSETLLLDDSVIEELKYWCDELEKADIHLEKLKIPGYLAILYSRGEFDDLIKALIHCALRVKEHSSVPSTVYDHAYGYAVASVAAHVLMTTEKYNTKDKRLDLCVWRRFSDEERLKLMDAMYWVYTATETNTTLTDAEKIDCTYVGLIEDFLCRQVECGAKELRIAATYMYLMSDLFFRLNVTNMIPADTTCREEYLVPGQVQFTKGDKISWETAAESFLKPTLCLHIDHRSTTTEPTDMETTAAEDWAPASEPELEESEEPIGKNVQLAKAESEQPPVSATPQSAGHSTTKSVAANSTGSPNKPSSTKAAEIPTVLPSTSSTTQSSANKTVEKLKPSKVDP